MDKTIDDLFILKLIKAGDRLAFKHLFELYFTPLCRFVHLYMKKPGAAEDIVVDIFASFWERRETLQIQITLKAAHRKPVPCPLPSRRSWPCSHGRSLSR